MALFNRRIRTVGGVTDENETGKRVETEVGFKEFPILSLSAASSTLHPRARWVTVMNGIQFIPGAKLYVAARAHVDVAATQRAARCGAPVVASRR